MAVERPLRILLIAHGFPAESVGGVEQHVDGLGRALAAAGHEVHVYSRSSREGAQGTLVTDHDAPFPVTRVVYRYEGIDSLPSLYANTMLDRALQAFLGRHQFDVAHVHHLTGLSTGALAVLQRAGLPTLLTLHDYWLICPRGQMWRRDGTACSRVETATCGACLAETFGDWLPPQGRDGVVEDLHRSAREILGLPRRLIVPSARVIGPYVALGIPETRFLVVENAVDTTALASVAPPRRPPGTPLRVGYLGTLIPSKGLDLLVEAVSGLAPGTASLDIFGNVLPYHGDEDFVGRVFGRLRPGDRVTYHGPYRTRDLPEILAGLDVVAVPALWHEAFGLTAREALAAGRPVVASQIGGLQDALQDGVEGFLVPPGDVAALARALTHLAGEPELLARMSAAARLRGRDFAAMAAELCALYREAAVSRRQRP